MAHEVGVLAAFETQDFSKGLRIYVEGIAEAERVTDKAVAHINTLSGALGTLFQSIGSQISSQVSHIQTMAAAFERVADAAERARQAGGSQGIVQTGDASAPEAELTDEVRKRLAFLKLIRAEQAARLTEARIEADLAQQTTSEYRKQVDAVDKRIIALERALRLEQAQQLGFGTRALEEAAKVAVNTQDLSGRRAKPLEDQIKAQQLLQQEVNDTRTLNQALLTLQRQQTNELERQQALINIRQVGIRRELRDAQATDLGIPPQDIADIREVEPIRDVANETLTAFRLMRAEIQDNVRLQQLQRVAASEFTSEVDKANARLQIQEITMERIRRDQQLLSIPGQNVQVLDNIRQQQIETTSELEQQSQLNQLIRAELADLVALEKLRSGIDLRTSGELERQQNLLSRQNIELQRQQRLRQAQLAGLDVKKLQEAGATAVPSTAAQAALQRQLEVSRLLSEEIADRTQEETIRLALLNRQTSEIERQKLLLDQQSIAARRNERSARAPQLGISAPRLEEIRNLPVLLNQTAVSGQRATTSVRELSVASVALGTAIGTIVVNALRNFQTTLNSLLSKGLETIRFFERLELSIQFFSASEVLATNQSLSFEQALLATSSQAEGLLLWLQRLAVASPFTTRDVGTLFRVSQAYGLTRREAERLTPLLLDFAAATGLSEDILERLALALGQVRARGKLTGEEIRQLGNSGLPIRDLLVRQLGIANSAFDDLVESGSLTSDVVLPAIIRELERFEGAGQRVAFTTIGGIVSAFQELADISSAKFLRSALEGIQKPIEKFFETLNKPEVLAFIQVLGEEVGVHLARGLQNATTFFTNLTDSIRTMDPVLRKQIIAFTLVSTALLAASAAAGVLLLALKLLLNPFTLLIGVTSLIVTEWTQGFPLAARVVGGFITEVTKIIADFASGAANLAVQIPLAMAKGILAGGKFILDAFNFIFGAIARAFNAAPSPTEGLPKKIESGLSPVAKIMQIHGEEGGMQLVEGFDSEVSVYFDQTLPDIITDGGKKAAEAAGKVAPQVGRAFIDGFLGQVAQAAPKISNELQKILDEIGDGPNLADAGAFAMGKFLDNFKNADFGVLSELGGFIQNALSSLVNLGDIEESDLPALVFGSREALIKAVSEFRDAGRISDDTLKRVSSSADSAGELVKNLLLQYTELATTTDATEAAQEKLNAVTEKYKEIITPLRKELERISELRQQADEGQEILSLQRFINQRGVGARRKEQAQLKIQEILQQRRVRLLEDERDTQTEAAQDELDSAEKAQQAAQKQFDLLKGRLDAQLQQLALMGQEASIFERLNEQLEKQREKEKTALELQQELLKLQQAEIADLIKAAKAKFVLDQSDSTELERQNALLDLQEVALARQQRLVEARELGFPDSELTKLYDIQIALDDIGEEADATTTSLDGMDAPVVEAEKISKEWNKTLEQTRLEWDGIKKSITDALTDINNGLPDFLRFQSAKEGEEAPLVTTLKAVAEHLDIILGILVAKSLLTHLRSLITIFGALKAASAVEATAGGAAAAGGGWFGAFISGLGGIAAAALAAYGALLFLGVAIEAFKRGEIAQFNKNVEEINETLGDFGPKLTEATDTLLEQVRPANPEAENRIRENIVSAATNAITDGLGSEHVIATVQAALERTITEGAIADTTANRLAILNFTTELGKLIGETPITTPNGTPPIAVEDVLPDETAIREGSGNFLKSLWDSIFNRKIEISTEEFHKNVESLISDAISVGMDADRIKELVNGQWQAGIEAGIVSDNPETRAVLKKYLDGIEDEMQKQTESQSPSKRFQRTIGTPIAQGIVNGMLTSLALLKPKLTTLLIEVENETRDRFIDIRNTALTEAETMRSDLEVKFEAVKNVVVNAFVKMRQDAETEITTLRSNVVNMLTGAEDSLISDLQTALVGTEDAPGAGFNLGKAFIEAMGKGIESGELVLARSIVTVLSEGLKAGAKLLDANQLINDAFSSSFGSQPATTTPSVNNYTTNRNVTYRLNVETRGTSQGVINDFAIMQALTPA